MSLIIRDATVADAPAISDIYAPFVRETVITFELNPPTLEETAQRIESYQQSHAYIVGEHSGEVVGYAYAAPFHAREAYRFACSVSVYMRQGTTIQGAGSQLLAELLDRLRKRGFHQAFGLIALPNDRSVGLHEKFGFERTGLFKRVGWKLDRWVDVGWWQLDLGLDKREPELR